MVVVTEQQDRVNKIVAAITGQAARATEILEELPWGLPANIKQHVLELEIQLVSYRCYAEKNLPTENAGNVALAIADTLRTLASRAYEELLNIVDPDPTDDETEDDDDNDDLPGNSSSNPIIINGPSGESSVSVGRSASRRQRDDPETQSATLEEQTLNDRLRALVQRARQLDEEYNRVNAALEEERARRRASSSQFERDYQEEEDAFLREELLRLQRERAEVEERREHPHDTLQRTMDEFMGATGQFRAAGGGNKMTKQKK